MASSPRILIVDSDEDHKRICGIILQRSGFEVFTMEPGHDFIQQVEHFIPQLIFLEPHFFDQEGMEVIRLLRGHPIHQYIPVVYFTSDDNISMLAREAGADGYLGKPFDIDNMLKIVRKFIPDR